jgi:hypothetical protein
MSDEEENFSLLDENKHVQELRAVGINEGVVGLFVTLLTLWYLSAAMRYPEGPLPVVSPTEIVFTRGEVYELHFTLDVRFSHLDLVVGGFKFPVGAPVGNYSDKAYYYSAVLPGLPPGKTLEWTLGCCAGGTIKTVPVDSPVVCSVGDTKPPMGYKILETINNDTECDLLIHMGDMSYISNDGGCYSEAQQSQKQCLYNCSADCKWQSRQTDERWEAWKTFFENVDLGVIPVVTQAGNHDNDLFWLYKFRPVSSIRLNDKFFYWGSQIVPGLSILSVSTEDNFNNPYERYLGGGDIDLDRWERNYGTNSRQYDYMEGFIRNVPQEDKLIVYTHRPPFHTSSHHPDCHRGGSWYRCNVRKHWGPLLDRADMVLSGHSHHYMKSRPSRLREAGLENGTTTFVVVGTGGYELTQGLHRDPHVLELSGENYGYMKGEEFKIVK